MPTKKSSVKKAPKSVKPTDPRAALAPTPANLTATLSAIEAVLKGLTPPKEPHPGDLVQVMVHLVMSEGLPCGYGQEAVRRIEHAFVDRNEFRVTEAYEVAELLQDLEIPELFERCLVIRDAVAQIYNDQNSVSLEFLRDAAVGDRQSFFARVPAIPSKLARQLVHVLHFEEAIFAEKPGPRLLQRLGLEAGGEAFCTRAQELLKPWGHVPFLVAPDAPAKEVAVAVRLEPVLSPGGLLLRLAPSGKK